MFTLKFYSHGDAKMKILEAESVTVLRNIDGAEVTMHRKDGDVRFDVKGAEPPDSDTTYFDRVIIENSLGKTTEIIWADPTFYKAVQRAA